MNATEEHLESWFQALGKAETYARQYWAWLKGRGPQPNPRQYHIGDDEAQAVRIKLAGSVAFQISLCIDMTRDKAPRLGMWRKR